MVTFAILYMLMSYISKQFLDFVFGNTEAMNTIFALVLFMGIGFVVIASTLGNNNQNQSQHNNIRTWGIGLIVFSILTMVAMEIVAKNVDTVQIVVSLIIALGGMIFIKRNMMIPMSNRNGLPNWFRWVLRLI